MGWGKKIGIGVGIGVLGLFIIAVVVDSMITQEKELEKINLSTQELDNLAVHWNYNDILRNPEKYKGKIIRFDGEVFRAETIGEDHYALTVWIKSGNYGTDTIIVDWSGKRVLGGDNIRVYGEVERIVELGSMLAPEFKSPYPYVKAIRLILY